MLSLRLREGAAPVPEGRAGATWQHDDGDPRGEAIIGSQECWLQWHGVGLFRFRPGVTAVDAWARADVPTAFVRDTFDHEIQPLILQSLGFETMHGASASGPDGGVALCGRSGAGKSTLAYALGRMGWDHLSDDHVILDFSAPQPRLRTVPFKPRLRPLSARHFGNPEARPIATSGIRTWRPLRAVLIVEQVDQPGEWCELQPIAPTTAFPELLPHAHAFDPHDAQQTARLADHYLTLVERVPIYRLRYRPSFSRLDNTVRAVQKLVRGLAQMPPAQPRVASAAAQEFERR